jgi:Fe-S oxidoreductase
VEDGYAVVVLQPSCGFMLRSRVPWLLGTSEARKVAEATRHLGEYLGELQAVRRLRQDFASRGGRFILHTTCLERARGRGTGPGVLSLLPGARVRTVERCSGMGGLWGLKARHHEISLKTATRFLGEIRSDRDEIVVSDCLFTGLGVRESLGSRARHSAEILRDAYGLSPSGDLPARKGKAGT